MNWSRNGCVFWHNEGMCRHYHNSLNGTGIFVVGVGGVLTRRGVMIRPSWRFVWQECITKDGTTKHYTFFHIRLMARRRIMATYTIPIRHRKDIIWSVTLSTPTFGGDALNASPRWNDSHDHHSSLRSTRALLCTASLQSFHKTMQRMSLEETTQIEVSIAAAVIYILEVKANKSKKGKIHLNRVHYFTLSSWWRRNRVFKNRG